MMLALLAFTTFIQNNPGFVAWLVGGLFSVIAALLIGFWTLITTQIGDLRATDKEILVRVEEAERILEKVKDCMETRANDVNGLRGDIRDLHTLVHRQGVENMSAHSAITERLVRVETKMPNGELGEAIRLLKQLVGEVK